MNVSNGFEIIAVLGELERKLGVSSINPEDVELVFSTNRILETRLNPNQNKFYFLEGVYKLNLSDIHDRDLLVGDLEDKYGFVALKGDYVTKDSINNISATDTLYVINPVFKFIMPSVPTLLSYTDVKASWDEAIDIYDQFKLLVSKSGGSIIH